MTYFEHVLKKLQNFEEGITIIGGNFNMILDPTLDTSKVNQNTSYTNLKLLKCLHESQWMDIWRILHPKEGVYSFYSSPHKTYSRIN